MYSLTLGLSMKWQPADAIAIKLITCRIKANGPPATRDAGICTPTEGISSLI